MSAPDAEPALSKYRVAAIQYEPTLGEKQKNLADLLRLTEEAALHGAKLIVHPEMATTGYCWLSRQEIAPYVEPIAGPTTERFAELAACYDCYIATSLPEVDPETNAYYNSLALIGPAGLIGVYRKVHSYISEPRWARDGDLGFPVWDTPLGRLGGVICQDASFFEATRLLALRGADVLLFPTNWLDEKCPSAWWMARAFENGCYFIAADRYGRERGVQFSGGSCILDPDGSIQAYLDSGEGIVYGRVDLERCRDKRWGPSAQDDADATRIIPVGDRIADRRPAEYATLANNTYLWEPLLYHGLYNLGELPPGQLSCVGIIQTDLSAFFPPQSISRKGSGSAMETLSAMLRATLRDHEPARPDVLALPELMLPGPFPEDLETAEAVAFMQAGAIQVPGPETDALAAQAAEFQLALVIGVAERATDPASGAPAYYNTVLLIDPEGVYGKYRKLHLTANDRLWAAPGDLGLPTFDTSAGRIGLATGYDVLFPETLRVLAGEGADLVCAPAYLNFPHPIGLAPSAIPYTFPTAPEGFDPTHFVLWRVRADEHEVYLALANWHGRSGSLRANGHSGIFSPSAARYPWNEVIALEEPASDLPESPESPEPPTLSLMTIDTREQRTGRRSSTVLGFAPGEVVGSLTGELAYDIRESIPGNAVRAKPLLRKRLPYWYLDLIKPHL